MYRNTNILLASVGLWVLLPDGNAMVLFTRVIQLSMNHIYVHVSIIYFVTKHVSKQTILVYTRRTFTANLARPHAVAPPRRGLRRSLHPNYD